MMIRTACVAMLGLVIVVPCCGQTSQGDSQTLQAILTEIREIHEELRVTETTQILLAEMEMQQNQVNRAEQRVDEAQSKLSQLKTDRRYFEGELARSEDVLKQATEPLQQRQLTESIESLRIAVEKRNTEEQESTARVQQAQEQLRNAEDTLDRIQDELNIVVKVFEPATPARISKATGGSRSTSGAPGGCGEAGPSPSHRLLARSA